MLSFKMALRSIGSNKMRAVLTMLGIIIGVMALVVLVSLVKGATTSVTDAVADLGSNLLSVSISDDKGKPVSLSDLDKWTDETPELGQIAPYASASMSGMANGETGNFTVYGTTAAYYDIQGLQLSMGRWLKSSDVDNHSYVCVINENAAEELVGYVDCVGQAIRLNNVTYTIVGVLASDEDSLTGMLTAGSMIAYVPYTSLVRLSTTTTSNITQFYVSAGEGITMESAEDAMESILLNRFEDDDDAFSISSQNVLEEAMDSITSVLSIMLGGIAAISLVVGGIGIMNIMLVTVTERTREIGIRKAIGASRQTILTQFLIEAVVLCMLGCGLGIFLSWAILQIVNTIVASLDMVFVLNGSVVLIAVVFCFIIGVIFGLYPANKAAKMKPIDALHYGG
ncbi:MAG: ABC transporter permease [Oscillospiraceae bacterium]|nr:ABC transporter permease [Oscillospiraceae bacterium]